MALMYGSGDGCLWMTLIKVQEGVKINAKSYCELIYDSLSNWLENLNLKRRRKIIFMHDNAPSHAANKTTEFLHSLGFKKDILMDWPACFPDLNPI